MFQTSDRQQFPQQLKQQMVHLSSRQTSAKTWEREREKCSVSIILLLLQARRNPLNIQYPKIRFFALRVTNIFSCALFFSLSFTDGVLCGVSVPLAVVLHIYISFSPLEQAVFVTVPFKKYVNSACFAVLYCVSIKKHRLKHFFKHK